MAFALTSAFSLLPFSCAKTSSVCLRCFANAAAASQTPLLLTLFIRLYLASLPHFLFTSLLPHEGREVWWRSCSGAAAEEGNRGKEDN